MGTVVIIVIVVILAIVVALSLRLFSVERVETTQESPFDLPEAGEETEDGEAGGEAAAKKAEMVNVFDYFNEEDEEKNDGDQSQDADNDAPDSGSASSSSTGSTDATGVAETIDKLTELKSGRAYFVDCKKALESAREEGNMYCACYFDYDRFSYINSLKGALTGDYVLTHTAQHIKRIFPEGSVVTRISCDHFLVVLPLVDIALFNDYYEQLNNMCEKIRNDTGVKAGMRICMGFACTDDDSCYDINVLMARANIARHCVKVAKAEKFEIFEESMISTGFYGDTIMETYSECQYDDEIVLYFEKMADLATDKIFGCDTLARWMYDDKNAVTNNNPITLDNGHIPTNNDKVIYQVCRSMSRWRKAARQQLLVFVELPVTDFFKSDIDEFFGKCLTEFQIDPQTLAVKVDVAFVRLNWSACSSQLKKLKDIGLKICISGIDTGYTNLDFMSGLPIDYVKLHKSFAYNIDRSPEQVDKCRKIVERATHIGAKAIFEGVNYMEQVTALKSANAKLVQGKHMGKIANADELTRDLPEHIERRNNDVTVVLDDKQLAKGEFKLF